MSESSLKSTFFFAFFSSQVPKGSSPEGMSARIPLLSGWWRRREHPCELPPTGGPWSPGNKKQAPTKTGDRKETIDVRAQAHKKNIQNETKRNGNENETKRNETTRHETTRNETKRNETKRNETKRNEMKRKINETRRNEMRRNETKRNETKRTETERSKNQT